MGAFAGKGGKKKSGGIIGGLKKVGGAAVNLLGAPQQAVFRTGAGLGALLEGEGKAALGHFGHAVGELGSLGQMGGDIDFARAVTTEKNLRAGNIRKLPGGVNMGANLLLDPLLFLGAGKGAQAAKGVSTLAKTGGTTEKAVSAALKAGTLDLAKGSTVRSQLVSDLMAGGTKAKQAEKIAKMTNRRGAGGVTAFIPGTEISRTLVGGGAKAGDGLGIVKGIKALPGGAATVKGFEQTFQPSKRLSGLKNPEIEQAILRLGDLRQNKLAASQDDLANELMNAAQAVGRKIDDTDKSDMLRSIEAGDIGGLVARKPELAPMMEVLERNAKALTTGQTKRKLLDKGTRQNYMQRLPTEDLAKMADEGSQSSRGLLESEVTGGIDSALKQSAERARSIFPDMPAPAINELKAAVDAGLTGPSLDKLLQTAAFKKFVPKDPDMLENLTRNFESLAKEMPSGSKLYEENALASLLNRATSANKAMGAVDYIGDLKALDGGALLLDEAAIQALAQSGKSLPKGYVKDTLPHIGDIAAPADLMREIKRVVGVVGQDDMLAKIVKGMDAWTKFWKTHATTGILGALPFGVRNGRSNLYLMHSDNYEIPEILASMKEMKTLEDKVRKVTGLNRRGKFVGEHAAEVSSQGLDAAMLNALTGHEYDMWKALQKEGITTRGFFDHDVGGDVFDKVRKITGDMKPVKGGKLGRARHVLLDPTGNAATAGRAFNQAVETNARMALFNLNMARYGNVAEASRATKKVLFDYSELTAVEQKLLKNIIPFYTFMRKNLPRQLETLIENPTRIVVPEKISQAGTTGLDPDAPDYQQEAGSRVLPGLLPLFGGQISTPDRPFQAAVDTISPLSLALRGRGTEAARAAVNVPGGPQIGLFNSLAEAAVGKDMFTGGNVKPGLETFIQRLLTSQVPSLARVPRRAGPIEPTAVLGKSGDNRPTANELLKFLTGLRVQTPQ